MNKNFLFAVSTLIGAIVGLGMFGIPYAAAKAGFFIALIYLFVLGGVTLLLHLMQGEIVERTKGSHRLPGYVEKYLGKKWKNILGAAIILSIYSALLAYIIVGGKFLVLLFPDFLDASAWSIIFWLVLSILVWRGIRTVAEVELGMTGLMTLFVFVLLFGSAGHIRLENFSGFNPADFFLPYGVILFAFSGLFAIPEIRELIKLDGKGYKTAIIWGTFIPGVVYFLFILSVIGVSGINTSEEALIGLVPILGNWITGAGAVFGLLAIATSYLVLGINLKRTFEYDWRFGSNLSALVALLIPISLFLAGLQQFIAVIGISGAVFGAVVAIAVILVYQKAQMLGDQAPGFILHVPKIIQWTLMLMFALGGVYEIIYLINF